VRIALVVNRDSGGGLDPAPLVRAMGGAEVAVFGFADLERAASARPDRVVAAGGDGTIAPVA
jgi:diacylglycerol kinase family enzyme